MKRLIGGIYDFTLQAKPLLAPRYSLFPVYDQKPFTISIYFAEEKTPININKILYTYTMHQEKLYKTDFW